MNHSLHSYTPALRFPDFLNDGEWEVKRLGEIAEFFKGKGIPKTEASNKGKTPCVRYGELYTHYKEIIDETQSFTDIPTEELFLSNANDVIIPSSGETKEDISTASCVIKDNIALGGDINVIRTPHNGVFLSYYLNNTKKDEIAKIAQGVSIIHLYNDQLKNLKIALPSIEEQKKIVDCLTVLDELIAATNGKLEQLKAYKKGLMQKLFPAKGKKLPELRFKEFEKDGEWEEKELGAVAKVKSGYAFRSNTYTQTGRYKIITISNVKNGYLDLTSNNFVEHLPEDIQPHQILQKGDILISMTGNVGRVCKVYCDNCLLNQRVGFVDVYSSDVDKNFIYTILTSDRFEKSMIENGQGAAQANIGNKDIEGYCFFCPPTLQEQRKVADSFTSIDEMTNQYTNKVTLLELYKKGLMQQLFPTSK